MSRQLEASKMTLPGEIRTLKVKRTTLLIVCQKCEAQIKAFNAELHHLKIPPPDLPGATVAI